ncbi:hypothetical protein [Listeria valentina]|uniref:hypothetical protein n=1 Tax=Listeria valentina TaxID=2705293 RepID=UPI00142F4430|nr:hypothetical protein [Listeria valentina]
MTKQRKKGRGKRLVSFLAGLLGLFLMLLLPFANEAVGGSFWSVFIPLLPLYGLLFYFLIQVGKPIKKKT